MALEATHIRFALDLKDVYEVRDVDAFVSGAVYPDSRYVTGIDRLATHPDDYLHDPMFRASDFKKGWHAHLLGDTVQGSGMTKLLPMVKSGPGEESWIERTAIKILQDIDDVNKFAIADFLPSLAHVENPNGEDMDVMRGYNKLFENTYKDPANTSIDDLYEMWAAFGVGDELRARVKETAERFAQDSAVMEGVKNLYDTMLFDAKQLLR